jgi:hypothetical protein
MLLLVRTSTFLTFSCRSSTWYSTTNVQYKMDNRSKKTYKMENRSGSKFRLVLLHNGIEPLTLQDHAQFYSAFEKGCRSSSRLLYFRSKQKKPAAKNAVIQSKLKWTDTTLFETCGAEIQFFIYWNALKEAAPSTPFNGLSFTHTSSQHQILTCVYHTLKVPQSTKSRKQAQAKKY